jgi:hypothetical protein
MDIVFIPQTVMVSRREAGTWQSLFATSYYRRDGQEYSSVRTVANQLGRPTIFLERKEYSGLEGLEVGPEVDLPVLQAQLGADIVSVGDNGVG